MRYEHRLRVYRLSQFWSPWRKPKFFICQPRYYNDALALSKKKIACWWES